MLPRKGVRSRGGTGAGAGVWGAHLARGKRQQRKMPSTDRNLLNIFLKVFDVVSREFKLFSPDFLRLGDIKLES